jgi:hypothetical protein
MFGREVIRGYGATLLPLNAGRYIRYVPLFTPVAPAW